jgi:hypothetical protein
MVKLPLPRDLAEVMESLHRTLEARKEAATLPFLMEIIATSSKDLSTGFLQTLDGVPYPYGAPYPSNHNLH